MYDYQDCSREDFEKLYGLGWSQKEVFDVVEHAGTLLKNGRILSAYSEQIYIIWIINKFSFYNLYRYYSDSHFRASSNFFGLK